MNSFLRTITLFSLLYIAAISGEQEERSSNGWSYELYTPNALRNGIQGPAVSPTKVTVGSVVGQTIYQLDVPRKTFSTFVNQPYGEADDEVFGPDGTLVWTSLLSGVVRSRSPAGTIKVIAEDGPVSPNGVAFDTKGNAYYSQFPVGQNIYKVDPTGVKPKELVYTAQSGVNGFDFSATNEIYAPYPFLGQVVKINLVTKTETVVAAGFIDPEAVRFSADKTILYVLDIGTSSVYTVNIRTGAKTLVVKVPGLVYLDNFRPYGNGLLISDTTSNSPVYYDLTTKKQSYVTPVSVFNLPMGISYSNGKIYIADFTAQKEYNPNSNKLTTIARSGPQPDSVGPSAVNVSYGIYNVEATSKLLAFSCFYDSKVQIRSVKDNSVVVNSIPAGLPYGLGFSSDSKTLIIADHLTGLRVNTGATYQNSKIYSIGDNTVAGVGVSPTKANTVYVSTYSGSLYVVNYATGATRVLASGFMNLEGLTVVKSGNSDIVYVADTGAKTLVRVASNGAKTVVATGLPIGLPGPDTLPPINTFTGVTADASGDVYITSDINDALIKVGCGRK